MTSLKIRLFTDGADADEIVRMAQHPWIAGFTTNPSLLKKAGVSDYPAYARDLLARVTDKPISFEVLADDLAQMEAQARIIAGWGPNVYVKLPVQTSQGVMLYDLVHRLSHEGIRINLTTVFTRDQVAQATQALAGGAPANISVFAGRLADVGEDPLPLMRFAVGLARGTPNIEIIWASTREVFNVLEADRIGCHIITAPADMLAKYRNFGRSGDELSREAVRLFVEDTRKAGLSL